MKNIRFNLLTAVFLILPGFVFADAGGIYSAEELYSLSMQNSSELAILRKDEELQLLKKREAESNYFPKLDFDSSFTYISNPLEPVKIKAGQLGSYHAPGGEVLLPPVDYVVWEGMENTLYNFKLTLEQPIWSWGKIPAGVSIYENAAAIKREQIAKRRNEIRTEILVRIYGLKYASKISDILQEQQVIAERMVEIAEESNRNGFLIKSDVIEARVEAQQVSIAAAETQKIIRQSLLRLERFSGIEELSIEQLRLGNIPSGYEQFPIPVESMLMANALSNNDNLKLLSVLEELGRSKQELARGDNYLKPDVGLRVEMGYGGPRLPFVETDWFGKDRLNMTASIGISSRLIDGGELTSKILYEEQELEKLVVQYEDTSSMIKEFMVSNFLDMEMDLKNHEYYQLKAASSDETIMLEKIKIDNGIGNELDYLKARIDKCKNIIAGYQEMIHYMKAYCEVYAAAGLIEDVEKKVWMAE